MIYVLNWKPEKPQTHSVKTYAVSLDTVADPVIIKPGDLVGSMGVDHYIECGSKIASDRRRANGSWELIFCFMEDHNDYDDDRRRRRRG